MYSRNLPIGAAYNVQRVPKIQIPKVPLLSAPSPRFDHGHKGPHFAVLPLDLENLSAAGLNYGNILTNSSFQNTIS